MSDSGCDVDLVLIETEGQRAIDVFHLTRYGAKLTAAEQQALIANVQRALEGRS
jgi:[protein-PII] uridylyltransferase